MCEMLSIMGKKLEENTKDKKRLEGYFVILERWSKSKVCCIAPKHLPSSASGARTLSQGHTHQLCPRLGVCLHLVKCFERKLKAVGRQS